MTKCRELAGERSNSLSTNRFAAFLRKWSITMSCVQLLNLSSAIAAGLAAVFWFASSLVRTPSSYSIKVIKPSASFGSAMGTASVGHGASPELDKLATALIRQSRRSSLGAIFAACAALLQGIAIGISS